MTIVATRFFAVEVRLQAPHLAALDEASARLERQLRPAVAAALAGVKVDGVETFRLAPWGERFERVKPT